MYGLVLMQVKKYLAKESAIKIWVRLELNFHENKRQIDIFLGWRQNAVQPERGLFDFFRTKTIALPADKLYIRQLQHQFGRVFE